MILVPLLPDEYRFNSPPGVDSYVKQGKMKKKKDCGSKTSLRRLSLNLLQEEKEEQQQHLTTSLFVEVLVSFFNL